MASYQSVMQVSDVPNEFKRKYGEKEPSYVLFCAMMVVRGLTFPRCGHLHRKKRKQVLGFTFIVREIANLLSAVRPMAQARAIDAHRPKHCDLESHTTR